MADAKPKAQIILDAAKVSAASGGNSEPKQGQRSQSARGFCHRSTMRVPQPDIIEHFGNADAVPQPSERCLSRKAGIVRYCLNSQPNAVATARAAQQAFPACYFCCFSQFSISQFSSAAQKNVVRFVNPCRRFPLFLTHLESIILYHRKGNGPPAAAFFLKKECFL